MFALISLNEEVLTGYRVAEVAVEKFEVAEPLFWVACDDTCKQDLFFYNPATKEIVEIPVAPPDTVVPVDTGAFVVG